MGIREVLTETVDGILAFADLMCYATDRYGSFAVAVKAPRTPDIITKATWAGDVPKDVVSKSPFVVLEKLAELLRVQAPSDQLVMTPVQGDKFSRGWMGGAAKENAFVAASKWDQEIDRLKALILLYQATSGYLCLHHAGRRFPDRAAFEAAQEVYGFEKNGLVRNAEDHERIYYQMSRRGTDFYRELQFFENPECQDGAWHMDFQTNDPVGFLEFLGSGCDVTPVIFSDVGPNDPVGVVWVTGGSGDKLGIMARSHWWEV